MKSVKIILSAICIFFLFQVKAQNRIEIKGVVIDSIAQKYMDNGWISVRSYNLKNALFQPLNQDGTFKIIVSASISDTLVISAGSLGYKSKSFNLVANKTSYDFGLIYLSPGIKELIEVLVHSSHPLFENKADGFVYRVDLDKEAKGLNLYETLRRAPFVSVDPFGNVEIKGNTGIKILVNGRPSPYSKIGLSEALKNLSSSNIKQIDIITNPSARYDSEGITGIINIVMVKKPFEGFNGSTFVNGGTRNSGTGLDLNYGGKKFDFISSLNLGTDRVKGESEYSRTSSNSLYSSQTGNYTTNTLYHSYNLAYTYSFSESETFSANVLLDLNYRSLKGNYLNNNIEGQYNQATKSKSSDEGFSTSCDYLKVYKSSRHYLSGSAAFRSNGNLEEYDVIFSPASLTEIHRLNSGIINEFTGQIDYSNPIGNRKWFLEIGSKGLLRQISSNELNTKLLALKQNILGSYIVFEKTFKSTSLKTGARAETTFDRLNQNSGQDFERIYTSVMPSLIINQTISKNVALKFGLNSRVQRPGLSYINSFINNVDLANLSYGNPALKPERSYRYNLDGTFLFDKGSLSLSTYFTQINSKIESYRFIEDEITKSTFLNIGKNHIYGASLNLTLNGLKNFSFNLGGDFGYYKFFINNQIRREGTRFSGRINQTWKVNSKLRWNAYLYYTSPLITFQSANQSSFYSVFSLRHILFKGNGSIGISADNPFYDKFQIRMSQNTDDFNLISINRFTGRSLKVNFFYSFGEEKRLRFKRAKGINNEDLKKKEPEY